MGFEEETIFSSMIRIDLNGGESNISRVIYLPKIGYTSIRKRKNNEVCDSRCARLSR